MSDNVSGIIGLMLIITVGGVNIRFGLDRIAKAIEAQNVARKSEGRKP